MISEEIKNIKSGKRELKQFGITIAVVLAILSSWFLWQGRDSGYILLIIAILFLALGLFLPNLLKPLQKMWMTLAVLLGWVMTRVILIVLFYLVVTPIGLLARICGKDFLNRKFDREAQSFWIERKSATPDKKKYENQF